MRLQGAATRNGTAMAAIGPPNGVALVGEEKKDDDDAGMSCSSSDSNELDSDNSSAAMDALLATRMEQALLKSPPGNGNTDPFESDNDNNVINYSDDDTNNINVYNNKTEKLPSPSLSPIQTKTRPAISPPTTPQSPSLSAASTSIIYNPLTNYVTNSPAWPRRREIMGMSIVTLRSLPQSGREQRGSSSSLRRSFSSSSSSGDGDSTTISTSCSQRSVCSSDARLEARALQIRRELRHAELVDIVMEAERAMEAGVERFTGRPSTYGSLDTKPPQLLATTSLQMPVPKPSVERMQRHASYAEGTRIQRSALSAHHVVTRRGKRRGRRRATPKISVRKLRDIHEVFPTFGQFHKHLRTHLARSGIPEEPILIFHEEGGENSTGVNIGVSNQKIQATSCFLEQSSNINDRHIMMPPQLSLRPRPSANFFGQFGFDRWAATAGEVGPPRDGREEVETTMMTTNSTSDSAAGILSEHMSSPNKRQLPRVEVPIGLDSLKNDFFAKEIGQRKISNSRLAVTGLDLPKKKFLANEGKMSNSNMTVCTEPTTQSSSTAGGDTLTSTLGTIVASPPRTVSPSKALFDSDEAFECSEEEEEDCSGRNNDNKDCTNIVEGGRVEEARQEKDSDGCERRLTLPPRVSCRSGLVTPQRMRMPVKENNNNEAHTKMESSVDRGDFRTPARLRDIRDSEVYAGDGEESVSDLLILPSAISSAVKTRVPVVKGGNPGEKAEEEEHRSLPTSIDSEERYAIDAQGFPLPTPQLSVGSGRNSCNKDSERQFVVMPRDLPSNYFRQQDHTILASVRAIPPPLPPLPDLEVKMVEPPTQDLKCMLSSSPLKGKKELSQPIEQTTKKKNSLSDQATPCKTKTVVGNSEKERRTKCSYQAAFDPASTMFAMAVEKTRKQSLKRATKGPVSINGGRPNCNQDANDGGCVRSQVVSLSDNTNCGAKDSSENGLGNTILAQTPIRDDDCNCLAPLTPGASWESNISYSFEDLKSALKLDQTTGQRLTPIGRRSLTSIGALALETPDMYYPHTGDKVDYCVSRTFLQSTMDGIFSKFSPSETEKPSSLKLSSVAKKRRIRRELFVRTAQNVVFLQNYLYCSTISNDTEHKSSGEDHSIDRDYPLKSATFSGQCAEILNIDNCCVGMGPIRSDKKTASNALTLSRDGTHSRVMEQHGETWFDVAAERVLDNWTSNGARRAQHRQNPCSFQAPALKMSASSSCRENSTTMSADGDLLGEGRNRKERDSKNKVLPSHDRSHLSNLQLQLNDFLKRRSHLVEEMAAADAKETLQRRHQMLNRNPAPTSEENEVGDLLFSKSY